MFQMIVTVVAIGLGIILAVASAPYIGETFLASSSQGHVATLVGQGQQISSAAALYHNERVRRAYKEAGGNGVAAVQELADRDFLSSLPSVPEEAFQGAARQWRLHAQRYAYVDGLLAEICNRVNREAGMPDANVKDGIAAEFSAQAIQSPDGDQLPYGCASAQSADTPKNYEFRYAW